MGKKKEGEDREKSLPQEIFGQAMISHGGEYTSESAYGQALLRLGSTMERMARLQEVQTNPPLSLFPLSLAPLFHSARSPARPLTFTSFTCYHWAVVDFEAYVHKATESALDTMERGLVQMKDYQTARKKLESRRLAYDSVLSKVQKMKKEDVRTEEELRSARAKYEETSEDVHNRMMTIQEAEVPQTCSIVALSSIFLSLPIFWDLRLS